MATRQPAGMPKIIFDEKRQIWCTKVSYTDRTGKLCRKSLYGKNQTEVANKIKQFNKDKDAGVNFDAEKVTLGQWPNQWLNQWLVTDKKPSLEVTSDAAYQNQIEQRITPELGVIKLKKLQRIQIQEFFNKKAADLAPATLELIRAILVNALKAAVIDGYIIKNPAIAIKLPQVKSKDVNPLDKEEIAKLLAAAKL